LIEIKLTREEADEIVGALSRQWHSGAVARFSHALRERLRDPGPVVEESVQVERMRKKIDYQRGEIKRMSARIERRRTGTAQDYD